MTNDNETTHTTTDHNMRPTQTIRPDEINVTDSITIPTPMLYRCYNAEHQLLYIGMTMYPIRRLKHHRRAAPWWSQTTTIELSSYRNHRALEQAELRAIRFEKPLFNHVGARQPGVARTNDRGFISIATDANRFGTTLRE